MWRVLALLATMKGKSPTIGIPPRGGRTLSGDRSMRARRPLYRQGTALVVLLACLAGAGRAAADAKDEERLRERALQLNEITGQGPISGEILALLEDRAKESTRQLLKVAHQMALDGDKDKNKDAVFNINAALILARAAHALKENGISEYFYRQYAKK